MIVDRIRKAAESSRDQTLELLGSLVEENSFSGNPEGINRVGGIVLANLPRSFEIRTETDSGGARHHVARGPAGGKAGTLLLGHLDTVFPPGDSRNPLLREREKIRGPGTADMKGGIVVMVQALRILDRLGFVEKIPLICLFNGDEEVGSPFSEGLIRQTAREARRGLVFESGGSRGEIVIARRGVARFELEVKGKAGHAGGLGAQKASAVAVLARKITALEGMNDPERGISLNVGTISGGQATNIVPDRAMARFEFRFWDDGDEDTVYEKIQKVVSSPDVPGCLSSLHRFNRRPGMKAVPGSRDLAALVRECASALGQEVGTEKRGGASDGNFLSDMGIPVIDGLGPAGEMDHSPEEYIVEQSLHDRIELTALLLLRLLGLKSD